MFKIGIIILCIVFALLVGFIVYACIRIGDERDDIDE